MPGCVFCGRPLLPLLTAHPRCRKANREGRERLVELADRPLGAREDQEKTRREVERLERDAFVTRTQRGELLRPRFEERVRKALEDSVLTVEEETELVDFTDAFALGCDELDTQGWYTRFVQSAALRDLLHGKLPPAVLPMQLEPGEALIWLFPTAQLTAGELVRHETTATVAASIPVSHGLYYRVTEPAARSEEGIVHQPVDAGALGVTNRYAHFAGHRTRLRLRLEDLEDLEPTAKGVAFRRAEAAGKLQGFETGDGWFLMNLLTNARNARMG